jgi:uncharacterized membrane protein
MMQGDPRADTGEPSDEKLGVLLACFDGRKTAGKARGGLETELRSEEGEPLDTVVVEVNEKHKASTHDPGRVRRVALSAALVWGLCGVLAANGLASIIIWAAVGVIGGVLFSYYSMRYLSKSELTRIGSRLPAQSSALVMWVGTKDTARLLEATATQKPSAASVAAVGLDLTTRVFAGATNPVEVPRGLADKVGDKGVMSIVLLRYPDPETAKKMASQPPAGDKGAVPTLKTATVIRCDPDGRERVSDPSFGRRALAKADLLSWGGFGLVFGALAGAIGGGGVLGFIESRYGDRLGHLGAVRRRVLRPGGWKGIPTWKAQERWSTLGPRHVDTDGVGGGRPDHRECARSVRRARLAATRPQRQTRRGRRGSRSHLSH